MTSRQTQPFRKGPRQPGLPLFRMLSGRPVFLPNPQDIKRRAAAQKPGGRLSDLLVKRYGS